MRSEPLAWPPVSAQAASLLEEAADLLVLHRDFAAAVERCSVPKALDLVEIATQSTEVHVKPLLLTPLQKDALGYFSAVPGGGEIRPRLSLCLSRLEVLQGERFLEE
ncbi:peroxisome assembly protein 26 [Limosa lapponica baueri]|uniref:Peroxisome assembly protein 26 n=1 Tax=Limosa lapponica baueri TaxID=1758121 RepID=A0A2I0TEG3_LIMLA|nr:peroxisome assembly protein 26 [Limosa lapponica baueri]